MYGGIINSNWGEKEIYVGEEGGKMLQMEKFYVKWHEDFSKEISCD